MDVSQPAYILHSRPYRETSVIATLLTPEHGKLNAVIKGARSKGKRSTSKGAVLQPFQKLLVEWREKPNSTSDLVSLRGFEADTLRFPLEAESSFCGLYLNEILYRLLYNGVAVDSLFEQYEQALFSLLRSQNRSEQAWVLRQFEFQLLEAMGLNLNCETDVNHQPIQSGVNYLFYPEMGAYPVNGEETGGNGVPISGECLLLLSNLEFCEDCLPSWKRLLRHVLSLYLGSKPILSRQLFR